MKGDFSNLRFRPTKHYTSVLQQQGRVSLDSDANEQCAIYDHLRDTETGDFVGRWGGPSDDCGFEITVRDGAIHIGRGRYYVEGIFCENEHAQWYSDQLYLLDPNPTDAELLNELSQGSIDEIQVYLEVWRRLVTALDDPCLREPALGQADTTARAQTVFRVVARAITSATSAVSTATLGQASATLLSNSSATLSKATFTNSLNAGNLRLAAANTAPALSAINLTSGLTLNTGLPLGTSSTAASSGAASTAASVPQDCCQGVDVEVAGPPGKLMATTGGGSDDCSCQPTPAAGYIGLENQLYRVEIHESGDQNSATFKWSRENGSVVVAITGGIPGTQIQVDSLGPDANLGFAVGQWVEITDDTNLFGQSANQPGQLYQITAINPQILTVTLGQTVAGIDTTRNARLRRWDQVQFATSNGIPLSAGNPQIPLENGIQVQFAPGQYNSGDYWLIPARTATGNIEWPPNDPCDRDGSGYRLPRRTEAWRAPLACIEWANGEVTVRDCRNQFDNLVDLTKRPLGCCTIVASPQDLAGNVTLQSVIDSAATPSMFVQAASPGVSGNNITVRIANLQSKSRTPTFDLTVTETAVYRGLTTGGSTGIEGVIGDEESNLPNTGPLAHILVGSVNVNGTPADGQSVSLAGGGTSPAQGNIVDSSNKLVFTLQARSAGADGDLTRALISNLDITQSPPTFDLTLEWTKTLRGVSMATVFQQIQSNLSYEIVAQPPGTVAAVAPAERVTALSGGAEGNPNTGSNAVPAKAGIFGNPGKVCLRPGTYELSVPVNLTAEHSNLTIECCGGSAAITSTSLASAGTALPQGLFVLVGANNVTFSGLTFSLPPPVRLVAGTSFLPDFDPKLLAGMISKAVPGGTEEITQILNRLYVSVALRPVACTNVRVENCYFEFRNDAGVDFAGVFLQAGILAGGSNFGMTLLGNQFESPLNPLLASDRFLQFRAGYVLTHTVDISRPGASLGRFQAVTTDAASEELEVREAGTVYPAVLQDGHFEKNVFVGLEAPVVVFSECGAVALENNTVKDCYSGPWVVARRAPPDITKVSGEPAPVDDVGTDPVFVAVLALAQCYPLPEGFAPQGLTISATTALIRQVSFQNPVLAFLNAMLELGFALVQAASQLIAAAELDLSLHGVDNKIATYALPAWADSTGPGLVVWGEDSDFSTKVILSSNRIENSSAPVAPTAVIVQVQNCTMTGNLIFNNYNSTVNGGLYLGPLPPALSPSIAVTGNLFNANTNLASLVSPAAQTVGSGSGSNTVFNATLAQHPIQPGSVKVFSGVSQVGTDNGGGSVTGTGLQGTIDYSSGASSLTFKSAPESGTAVTISYLYSKWVPLNGP